MTESFLKIFDFHIPICLYACNFPQCSLYIPMALTGRICWLIDGVYNLKIISFILMTVNRDSDQQCYCYETKHVHSKEWRCWGHPHDLNCFMFHPLIILLFGKIRKKKQTKITTKKWALNLFSILFNLIFLELRDWKTNTAMKFTNLTIHGFKQV